MAPTGTAGTDTTQPRVTSHSPLTARNPSGGPAGAWSDVPQALWDDWRWQQARRLRRIVDIEAQVGLNDEERATFNECASRFKVAITPYYASLMDPTNPRCPIRLQALPQPGELVRYPFELDDPLGEDAHQAAPGVTHRYPDRVLFYVTHNCPVYCRHCTRKRKVADPHTASSADDIEAGLAYIRSNPQVRDVLVSGGDPLTLSDERLLTILEALADIDHVDMIRLGTRNPVTLPQRITPELAAGLSRIRSLYVHTHFNHPAECTDRAAEALNRLASAGCVLGNQMVLLRGVNDDPLVVEQLNRWLLRHRCRPYYMFQADMAVGITHFRTPLQRGIEIIDHLRGRLSGPGIPHFAVDLPGGGGKITLTPDYLVDKEGETLVFRNGLGESFAFHDVAEDDAHQKGSPRGGRSEDPPGDGAPPISTPGGFQP